MRPVITLLTDFGLEDPFVGIMKGVLLEKAPDAQIVDITHNVAPQNIHQAAYALKSAHSYFPKGTIHVVVVDPGVGSERRPILIETSNAKYIGPDNGVFSYVLGKNAKTYHLNKKKYFSKTVSATFHGRDVFAPVAGFLASGTIASSLGKKISDPVTLSTREPMLLDGKLRGEVIYIDRFGNLATNVSSELLTASFSEEQQYEVRIGKRKIDRWVNTYSDCPRNRTGILLNSWNHLEIFCNESHAADMLHAGPGTHIVVTPKKGSK